MASRSPGRGQPAVGLVPGNGRVCAVGDPPRADRAAIRARLATELRTIYPASDRRLAATCCVVVPPIAWRSPLSRGGRGGLQMPPSAAAWPSIDLPAFLGASRASMKGCPADMIIWINGGLCYDSRVPGIVTVACYRD